MINVKIFDKKIIVENLTVSDSVKFETVKFEFPDSWSGYTKTAVFKANDQEVYNVVLDENNSLCVSADECYIPHEVLKTPCFYLSVFGVSGESVATTTQAKVSVLQSGYSEGEEPSEPTPTEYQQLISLAAQTKEIAQSVRDDADNGAFKGEKGEPGKDAILNLDHVFNPESENAQSGKAVAEAVAKGIEGSKKIFAAAIYDTVSGGAVAVSDVSPFEHNPYVKILSERNRNIIPFPYANTSQTISGVTFTVNGDGTITVNGTATDVVRYDFQVTSVEEDKQYTFSGCPDGGGNSSYFLGLDTYQTTYGTPTTFIGTEIPEIRLCIGIFPGVVCDNLIFKPQLEYGSSATEYEGYISDFSGVKVSRYGKNLFTTKGRVQRDLGAYSNATQRNIVENSIYMGLAYNNYYEKGNLNYYKINGSNAVTLNSKVYTGYGIGFNFRVKPGETYTLSFGNYVEGIHRLAMSFYTADGVYISKADKSAESVTYTVPANAYWMMCIVIPYGDTALVGTDISFTDIMLELNSSATEYEPYKEVAKVTAKSDGTVTGLTSITPSMTLMTDAENTLINFTYNADIKAYIDKKLTS